MTTTRRGFTLVELLVAVVMLAIVGAAVYSLLINTQRVSRRQVERSNLQDNVRTGALILPAELREIGYNGNLSAAVPAMADADLIAIGADSVRFRAMRGIGFTCSTAPSANEIYIRKPLIGAGRDPRDTDDLLIFVEGDEDRAVDDDWAIGTIAAVTHWTCPGTNEPAIKVTFDAGGLNPLYLPHIVPGGPVRFFEVMTMGLYAANGQSWLGAKSISAGENYQPVLGPLADGNGLQFTYRTAANAQVPVGGDRNTIRTIEINLRGRSDEPVYVSGTGGPKIDTLSLKTRVALRNTLRP